MSSPAAVLDVLTVGDGDMSFSLALLRAFGPSIRLTCTTLESHRALVGRYSSAAACIAELRRGGARILHGVNAVALSPAQLGLQDLVIFNHPHLGSSLLDQGREDEHAARHGILLAHFFHSARPLLRGTSARVLLTLSHNQCSVWDVEAHVRRVGLLLLRRCGVATPTALLGGPTAEGQTMQEQAGGAKEVQDSGGSGSSSSLLPTPLPPLPQWAARRKYRNGSLGARHWLGAYGYEHRRCEGDKDMDVALSQVLVLALPPLAFTALVTTAGAVEVERAGRAAREAEGGGESLQPCPVCAVCLSPADMQLHITRAIPDPVPVLATPRARPPAPPPSAHAPPSLDQWNQYQQVVATVGEGGGEGGGEGERAKRWVRRVGFTKQLSSKRMCERAFREGRVLLLPKQRGAQPGTSNKEQRRPSDSPCVSSVPPSAGPASPAVPPAAAAWPPPWPRYSPLEASRLLLPGDQILLLHARTLAPPRAIISPSSGGNDTIVASPANGTTGGGGVGGGAGGVQVLYWTAHVAVVWKPVGMRSRGAHAGTLQAALAQFQQQGQQGQQGQPAEQGEGEAEEEVKKEAAESKEIQVADKKQGRWRRGRLRPPARKGVRALPVSRLEIGVGGVSAAGVSAEGLRQLAKAVERGAMAHTFVALVHGRATAAHFAPLSPAHAAPVAVAGKNGGQGEGETAGGGGHGAWQQRGAACSSLSSWPCRLLPSARHARFAQEEGEEGEGGGRLDRVQVQVLSRSGEGGAAGAEEVGAAAAKGPPLTTLRLTCTALRGRLGGALAALLQAAGHPVVGSRYAGRENASLPRSCKGAARGLRIECVAIECAGLLPPLAPLLHVEVPVKDKLLAAHWKAKAAAAASKRVAVPHQNSAGEDATRANCAPPAAVRCSGPL